MTLAMVWSDGAARTDARITCAGQGRWKKKCRGAGGGGSPISWGGGCRKGLLRPGLCTSPLFACSVSAACHTRAWDAGNWVLSWSLSLNFSSTTDASRFFSLKWLRKALYGQSLRPPPLLERVCVCVRRSLFLAAFPKSRFQRGGGLEPPPPPTFIPSPPSPQPILRCRWFWA